MITTEAFPVSQSSIYTNIICVNNFFPFFLHTFLFASFVKIVTNSRIQCEAYNMWPVTNS